MHGFLGFFYCFTAHIPTLAINTLILELETLVTYQCSAEIYTAREPELGRVLKLELWIIEPHTKWFGISVDIFNLILNSEYSWGPQVIF